MDWNFLVRYLGRYTVLFGGGTVAVAYLLPGGVRPYALLSAVAAGVLLVGRAAFVGGGGPTSGGDPAGAGLGLSGGNSDVLTAHDEEPADAGPLFYAIGLVVFGLGALTTLL